MLELGQGLRGAGGHDLAAGLLQRTLARQDICELDRVKLTRALADAAKRVTVMPGAVAAPRRGQPATAYCDACERPLWTWLVRALVAADQFEEATAVLATVKQEAERLGGASSEPLWYGHRAELPFLVHHGGIHLHRHPVHANIRAGPRVEEWVVLEHNDGCLDGVESWAILLKNLPTGERGLFAPF